MVSNGTFGDGGPIRRVATKARNAVVHLICERTVPLLAVMFCVGIAVTLWHLSRLSSSLVESGALHGISLYSQSLTELRAFYNSEVVERVRPQGIVVTHDYATKDGAVPIPATFTIEFGKRISEKSTGMQVRLYSDFPFAFRKEGGPKDDFERAALRELRTRPDKPFFRFEDFQGRPALRYTTAVRLNAGCIHCHNTHPESPKTDWKVGEVRGVQEIIQPLEGISAQTRAGLRATFALLLTMGLGGLGGLAVVIRKMRRNSVELEKRVAERASAEARLAALRDINVAITSTLDRHSVLSILMEKIDVVLPNIAVQVWLLNKQSGELERAACRNLDAEDWKRRKLRDTPALVKAAMAGKSPVIVLNVQTDPRTLDPAFYCRQGLISYLGVPLVIKEEVLGVIVFLTREEHHFIKEEVDFFSALASQAALAIHNSQIYEGEAQLAANLARSNKELEQFAYVASHDLQEPLRMITGYTNLLSKRYKGKLDDDADEFIGYAVDGANRLRVLINDLLTYSRVDTQGKIFAPTDCELILGQALVGLQGVIQESAAKVTHDPLPTVMGDDVQLGQLFQNLIGNALKYRNGNAPAVHIGCQRRDNDWLLSIRDNGIGIDPRFAEKIFVIFQRLHKREQYPGTGIGLAVCKRIVERHGGKIWVESAPGKGSTFYFTLCA